MRTGHIPSWSSPALCNRDNQQVQDNEVFGLGWEGHPNQEKAFKRSAGQPNGEALHLVTGAANPDLQKAKALCWNHSRWCDRSHHGTRLGWILGSNGVDDDDSHYANGDGECDVDGDGDDDDDDDDDGGLWVRIVRIMTMTVKYSFTNIVIILIIIIIIDVYDLLYPLNLNRPWPRMRRRHGTWPTNRRRISLGAATGSGWGAKSLTGSLRRVSLLQLVCESPIHVTNLV